MTPLLGALVALLLLVSLVACSRPPHVDTRPPASEVDPSHVDEHRGSPDTRRPSDFAAAGDAECGDDESDPEVVDCRLHVAIDYGDIPTLRLDTHGNVRGQEETIEFTQTVMRELSKRLEYEAKHPEVPLDETKLAGLDRAALDFIRSAKLLLHPRLVVIATKINVHGELGAVGQTPLYTLEQGTIVWWCEGAQGWTKPDRVKVGWYWIDPEGKCDPYAPKAWVASSEVENGTEHILISWIDYDVDAARRAKSQATQAGNPATKRRYVQRINVADGKGVVLLEIAPNFMFRFFDHFFACCLQIGFKKNVYRCFYKKLRNYVTTRAGGTSEQQIAKFLSGSVAHSVFEPMTRNTSFEVVAGTILVGSLIASLNEQWYRVLLGGVACGALRTLDDVVRQRERIRDQKNGRDNEDQPVQG